MPTATLLLSIHNPTPDDIRRGGVIRRDLCAPYTVVRIGQAEIYSHDPAALRAAAAAFTAAAIELGAAIADQAVTP